MITEEIARKFNANPLSEFSELSSNAEVIFLMVSDKAINEVSDKVGDTDSILIHCSGSVPNSR